MTTFLGVHDGHNAALAVVRNGRVEFALQEERLTREKNQGDAPVRALAEARGFSADTAPVGLNGHYMNYNQWRREIIIRDYERSSSLAGRLKQPFKGTFLDRVYQRRKAQARAEALAATGFARDRLQPVEHHLAHASAAYYTCPWKDGRTLVLTCDGSGDRLSATVSIGEGGRLTRIAEVSEHDSIGRVYALVTRRLAMTPLEHEYKVMGLAPYAKGPETERAAKVLLDAFEFLPGGLAWKRKRGVPSMYSAYQWLATITRGMRFDTLAGGAQRFIEVMLTRWVAAAVRETGIGRVACAGGVFMNVKANLALLDLPEVEDLYVVPSCGDESNSIGAACRLAAEAGERIAPLGPIYFGESITNDQAEAAVRSANGRLRSHFVEDIEARTAGELASGRIVARVKGRAEFGARALGNRSILARADAPDAVRTINQMIKNRDFWMPFAPSVLAERAADYYEKPKPVASPYMMLAFRTRPEKRAALEAVVHPYDFTTRPQEVTETHNPDYHRLLKECEARTGEGAILNTSLNLHGEPMVYRAEDAVNTFLSSDLEHMALANLWVQESMTGTTLVTGAAGFIGYHVARRLLEDGERVVGIDNLNPYYSPDLKRARLRKLHLSPRFEFIRLDIADRQAVEELFARSRFETVIHLAAQAGVRYSVDYPHVYAATNLTGFLHILEGVRCSESGHLVYASSSSVYGDSSAVPFRVDQLTDAPVSLYAATKKANELMAHAYSHLFGIRATGLRFFTVYGPWGRPDMAPMKFTRAILRGEEIEVYGYGRMQRDFTYVADVAEGVVRTARRPADGHRVFNVGFGSPVSLMDFIGELERALGQRARKRFLPLQAGDVVATHADSEDFWRMAGFRPRTPIEAGVARLVEWYREHYRIDERIEASRVQASWARQA